MGAQKTGRHEACPYAGSADFDRYDNSETVSDAVPAAFLKLGDCSTSLAMTVFGAYY